MLQEDSGSTFLDSELSYRFLWEAATEIVSITNSLASTQIITTVAEQSGYTLNADFLRMRLKDKDDREFIKYNDGTTNYFIYPRSYQEIILANNTTSQTIPTGYAIEPDSTLDSQISSTTTSAGVSSGGQATLTDTGSDFADVSPGDLVHNTTDGSDGVVISKTSSTALVTVLFGGTDNDWTSGDSYVIQPQGRLKIELNPPPSTASHTITVYYIQRPDPVFSDYGVYKFKQEYMQSLVEYALWRYKYKDGEPNFGDAFYTNWLRKVRMVSKQTGDSFARKGFKVNFKARR